MTPYWLRRLLPWSAARLAEAAALQGDVPWLDGERAEEVTTVAKKDGSGCLVCGTPREPDPEVSGGLAWEVTLCRDCTQAVASRALRRIVPKMLRAKLEQEDR